MTAPALPVVLLLAAAAPPLVLRPRSRRQAHLCCLGIPSSWNVVSWLLVLDEGTSSLDMDSGNG
jgi:hypothetical protein